MNEWEVIMSRTGARTPGLLFPCEGGTYEENQCNNFL